jgi:3',5'-cyclic AMP phosphodiesterase CpdA
MPPATTFVQLTDLHIGHAPSPFFDTRDNLEAVLAQIAPVKPAPDFIVLSGDLVDRGDEASYGWLRGRMARLGLPVFYALGNHDRRTSFRRAMLDEAGDEAPCFFAEVVAGLHLIVLDSSVPGAIGGTLDDGQLDWLAGEIGRHGDLPKLIVSHHPPAVGATADERPIHTIGFAQSARLGAILRGRKVLAILSGHVHHDRVSLWNGVPVVVGTGLHSAIDVLFPDGVRVVRGGSFCYGVVRPTGLTATFIPLASDRAEIRRILDRDRAAAR